jgi:hypothetical protein
MTAILTTESIIVLIVVGFCALSYYLVERWIRNDKEETAALQKIFSELKPKAAFQILPSQEKPKEDISPTLTKGPEVEPRMIEKKTKILTCRCTITEFEALKEEANQKHIDVSLLVRERVFKRRQA